MSPLRRRILVAEDNQAVANVIRYNLTRAGFEVTLALTGADAWNRLASTTFDLLITDYQMPEMDGAELCRRVRQYPQHRQMLIFMLTAKRFELTLEELRDQLGVTLAIPKPFSPIDLIKIVQQHLGEAAAAASG